MSVVGYELLKINSESNKSKVVGHTKKFKDFFYFIGNSFKDFILLFSPLITNYTKTNIYKLSLPVKVDHLVLNLIISASPV